jgi:hypothetical protein
VLYRLSLSCEVCTLVALSGCPLAFLLFKFLRLFDGIWL